MRYSSKSARSPVKSGAVRAARSSYSRPCLRCPPAGVPLRRRPTSEPPTPVLAEPVRLGTIRASISATGVVGTLPGATFTVVAAQPARIAEITKNVGDQVKSGETLVRFEFPSLRVQTVAGEAAVKAADLRVKQAELAKERIQSLVTQGAASRSELEDADREVTAAEAELAVAKAALGGVEAQGGNTIIRAPFDGTVTERLHNPGDTVRAEDADPILRLIDPKQVQVMATLPAAETTRFVIGATARAIAEGPPSRGEAALRRGSPNQSSCGSRRALPLRAAQRPLTSRSHSTRLRNCSPARRLASKSTRNSAQTSRSFRPRR